MADRIVYVCGCGTIGAIEINGSLPNYVKSRSWRKSDCGYVCHQPVTAVNLDRLLRVEKAAEEYVRFEDAGSLSADGSWRRLKEALHQQGR